MTDSQIVKSDVASQFGLSVDSTILSAEVLHSLETLAGGIVPEDAVKEHPGKGGKVFKYVSHIWVTQQLRNAFGQLWSMRVQTYQVFTDGSAVALVTLMLKIPTKDGFVENEITDIGAFDGGGGKMSAPMMIASAVSRGLVKCAMRRFGIGEEFYDSSEFELTPEEAWARLKRVSVESGLLESKALEILKGMNVDRDNIVDRYLECWKAIYAAAHASPRPGEL